MIAYAVEELYQVHSELLCVSHILTSPHVSVDLCLTNASRQRPPQSGEGWRVEGGRRRVEGGRWRVEDGLRMEVEKEPRAEG